MCQWYSWCYSRFRISSPNRTLHGNRIGNVELQVISQLHKHPRLCHSNIEITRLIVIGLEIVKPMYVA